VASDYSVRDPSAVNGLEDGRICDGITYFPFPAAIMSSAPIPPPVIMRSTQCDVMIWSFAGVPDWSGQLLTDPSAINGLEDDREKMLQEDRILPPCHPVYNYSFIQPITI